VPELGTYLDKVLEAPGARVEFIKAAIELERTEIAAWIRGLVSSSTLDGIAYKIQSGDYLLPPHHMRCGSCGQPFDMRDFDQVIAHEHDGPKEATGIHGVDVKKNEPSDGPDWGVCPGCGAGELEGLIHKPGCPVLRLAGRAS